ncbi:zinc finger, PHD-type containing protein [Tanacetum coccineum]
MEVLPHVHPLKLIDLNPKYPHDEVVYDDEKELIMKQDFRCSCGCCGQEINFYHRDDQKAKFDPRCKVCELQFDENLWIYKCEKCRYYVHTDCGTTSKKASLNAISLYQGTSAALKYYGDRLIPDLVHLPFPDETDMLKHFYGESGSRPFETNLTHPFHQHPLTLVDTPWCNNDITTTPDCITHTSHPNHLLGKDVPTSKEYCRLCLSDAKKQIFYTCFTCKFHIHVKCALLWPDTISHKYDKHPMTLRYFPVENYNGDYFCEVCEEEFNPNGAFYHCDQCVQSMHPACCVSILQKEQTPFFPDTRNDQHDNV